MLPLVTFPMYNEYLPNRLKPLAPNAPNQPSTGIPVIGDNSATPDDPAPIKPHTQLVAKKTFETGFGEQ